MDSDEDEVPGGDPHGGDPHGGDPHGGAGPGEAALPQDTVTDDPSLPAGTIVVTIKDAADKPVPRAPIKLGVLHSTVARGDTNEELAREADADGSARFDGLSTGSGHSYRVSTTRGAASYAYPPFGLGFKVGKRVALHSFEASGRLDSSMLVVMRSFLILSLHDDAIQVHELLTVMNMGKVSWLADQPFELPQGFKAFNKQEAEGDARVEEVPGSGAAIRGTFPPGQRDLEFSYQVPLEGEAVQTLKLRLPNRVSAARVAAEVSRTMTLEVKGFPAAKPVQGRDGKHVLLTDLAARQPGEASNLDITLGGLPTQGPGRWIAVALAALALIGGIAYFAQTRGALDEDAHRDLIEAREALLGEIVALERAHKTGDIGPKTYARIRASLLDALARIVTMIEAAEPKKPAAGKRPIRRAEAST
jgi:hypothetical protein